MLGQGVGQLDVCLQVFPCVLALGCGRKKIEDSKNESSINLMGEVWGSNPRPSEPQSDALTN